MKDSSIPVVVLALGFLVCFCYWLRQEVVHLWAEMLRDREQRDQELTLTREEMVLMWENLSAPEKGGERAADAFAPAGDLLRMPLHLRHDMQADGAVPLGEDIVPPVWSHGGDHAPAQQVSDHVKFRDGRDRIPREGAPRSPGGGAADVHGGSPGSASGGAQTWRTIPTTSNLPPSRS